jgi:hypothetical protein
MSELADYMTLKHAGQRITIDGLTLTANGLWNWCKNGAHGITLRHIRVARTILIAEADVEAWPACWIAAQKVRDSPRKTA